ncbi:C39 family peptidase [Pseudomonas sp. B22129]|uniref:C39 family peptidase n=1 Tax=Pseudomonas sp. B22129 TaxID=3235111 RepID=UPI00378426C6
MNANVFDISTKEKLPTCSGLISLTGYEPWPPRFIAGVKNTIQDNHPVIIRLHGAAEYPSTAMDRYAIDLESHAVMIVGFDDSRAAFEIIDPWNNAFGGINGGKRWLPYETAALTIVDASLGMMMVGSPPLINIQSTVDKAGNTSLKFRLD